MDSVTITKLEPKNRFAGMNSNYSDKIESILSCPFCQSPLTNIDKGYACESCETQYKNTKSGAIDLRLKQDKTIQLNFTLGNDIPKNSVIDYPLSINPHPEVDFSNMKVPRHLTKELISYFPKPKQNNSLMLDIGCGNLVHKEICNHAGFEYIGLDYNSAHVPILGDAHSLPFQDESFEFILSIAVLEHIRFPFVAMHEAHRVLKPGGKFIGTVAFLEPFHSDSYYHHTHLGVMNSLLFACFNIEKIAPSDKWSVLKAQASMGLFPKMPKLISNSLVFPLEIIHRMWWKAGCLIKGKPGENKRMLHTTGAFSFIAGKEPVS
jgi:ubiquinone/menaquinone biosynthesis C-methylase UbiE